MIPTATTRHPHLTAGLVQSARAARLAGQTWRGFLARDRLSEGLSDGEKGGKGHSDRKWR